MKNIKNLVFDLDDTLYPKSLDIESKFNENISKFFLDELNMEKEEFHDLVEKWKNEHNVNISSIAQFGINPDDFMNYICDVDVSKIEYNDELKKQLSSMPHKKIIYTNSTHGHVHDVLKNLKIKDLFHDIFTVKEADFVLKPEIDSYIKFLDLYKIKPNETVMFEDNLRNLKTAKEIGMTTILISEYKTNYHYVDYVVKNINEALNIFNK